MGIKKDEINLSMWSQELQSKIRNNLKMGEELVALGERYRKERENFWRSEMDLNNIQLSQEVIDAINEELRYQNLMAGSPRANEEDNGLSGQIITMATYLRKVEDSWTLSNGDEPALDNLRKVVATGIRALERFGCPRRNN